MYVKTDRFQTEEYLEAVADYERWLREPDDEQVNVWSIPEPDPGIDLRPWQKRLDAIGGTDERGLPKLRIVWSGTIYQTVEGQQRLQYIVPKIAEAQTKLMVVGDDTVELPYNEELWEPEYKKRAAEGAVIVVKDYIVEKALGLYVIQELVPARHAAKGKTDKQIDVSAGLYNLVHWISSNGEETGEFRAPNDSDIEIVRGAWEARLRELPHSPDEDTPAHFTHSRVRERMRSMMKRHPKHREYSAEEREESRERLLKALMDNAKVRSDRQFYLPAKGNA